MYRRSPSRDRRYHPQEPAAVVPSASTLQVSDEVVHIPSPVEQETAMDRTAETRKGIELGIPVLDRLLRNVTLEEIIIVGLIFILLQEHIEDEFLLLMLVYILLT